MAYGYFLPTMLSFIRESSVLLLHGESVITVQGNNHCLLW